MTSYLYARLLAISARSLSLFPPSLITSYLIGLQEKMGVGMEQKLISNLHFSCFEQRELF